LAFRGSAEEFASKAIALAVVFGTFAFIAQQAFNGVITIGDMLMYFGAIQQGGRDSEIGWSFWNSFTACDPVDVPHEDHSWINQYLIMACPFG